MANTRCADFCKICCRCYCI